MIVLASDTFIDIGIHVLSNGTTCECGALSDAFVKESATGIQDSTIQAVQVDLLDQLTLVPIFFFRRIFAFL